jgi:hypothetical protein
MDRGSDADRRKGKIKKKKKYRDRKGGLAVIHKPSWLQKFNDIHTRTAVSYPPSRLLERNAVDTIQGVASSYFSRHTSEPSFFSLLSAECWGSSLLTYSMEQSPS